MNKKQSIPPTLTYKLVGENRLVFLPIGFLPAGFFLFQRACSLPQIEARANNKRASAEGCRGRYFIKQQQAPDHRKHKGEIINRRKVCCRYFVEGQNKAVMTNTPEQLH